MNISMVHTDTPQDEAIDFGEIIGMLWRRKWRIILYTFIAAIAAAAYVTLVATPMFVANTSIVLQTRAAQIVNFESVVSDIGSDTTAINTEVEVLRSRRLYGAVVDRLDLTNDPEFNGQLVEPGIVDRFRATLTDRIKSLLGLAGDAGLPPPEPSVLRERVINTLLDRATIINIPLSYVFTVSVESESAQKAALLADTIAAQYVTDQIAIKFEATEQASVWLAERTTALEAELKTAEDKVQAFRAGSDIVDPTLLAESERQLINLRSRVAELVTARATANDKLARLQAAVSYPDKALAAQDDILRDLAVRLAAGEDVAAGFDDRFAGVLMAAMQDASRINGQTQSLEQSRDTLAATIARQTDEMIAFQQLSGDAEAVRLLYSYFLNRLKETSVQEGLQRADSRILSQAVVPENASSPNKKRIVAIAIVLGGMLGAVHVLVLEMREDGFRTASELEERTGVPVLGQIPVIRGKSQREVIAFLHNHPTDPPTEAIRNFRTSLLFSNVDSPPKVIVVSSSMPDEGKTTLSLALAQISVAADKKVLIVDCDLRRRALTNFFGMPARTEGIVSVLTKIRKFSDVVQHSDLLGADVLLAEIKAGQAVDAFNSNSFALLIAELRDIYDIVILDTPPVLVVPDARIVAQCADAVVMAVHADHTTDTQVRAGIRMFTTVGLKISGLVLNRSNPRHMLQYTYGPPVTPQRVI